MAIEQVWLEPGQDGDTWQMSFACQVCLRPFSERVALKWGFNAQALLAEAADRQRLFIEAQYQGNILSEDPPDKRTVVLRCIRVPGKGLLLALMGKVCAATPELAHQQSIQYCRELVSAFPTDYRIYPAISQTAFEKLAGKDMLEKCTSTDTLAKILRFEMAPIPSVHVFGCWQTSDRSDEQIWRALGNYPEAVVLNISLRQTQIQFAERQILWNLIQGHPSATEDPQAQAPMPLAKWAEELIKRRMSPWKKFYYLQVHLACPAAVSTSITRPIGAAITRETPDLITPGYQIQHPSDLADLDKWRQSLLRLDILPSEVYSSSLSRLSDIADLTEAQAVFRLPYPPEEGLPDVQFVDRLE